MRDFNEMISKQGLKRQEEITNLLMKVGFNYDEASDSAYIIYDNNQDKLNDNEIINLAKSHI